jgi:hypothetical protein
MHAIAETQSPGPLHFKITKFQFQHAKLQNTISKQTKPLKK